MLRLRDVPGLRDADIRPPIIAEPGDPFADLRVSHLLARLPRGAPIRLRDVVDALNAEAVDWSFSRPVVVAAIVQLQANWMVDYRNASGITLDDGPQGAEVTIEDTARVDPWMIKQVDRLAERCLARLRDFAVDEGAIP